MTLPPPRAVGFSVAGGVPTDAGDWATVDLGAFVDQRSRGIIVATEPVEFDGNAFELARLTRDLIVSELRAMHDLPPQEAIGRAFAAANGMMHDESLMNPTRGYDRKVLVGATAILFDGHLCSIGHVPPGQVLLIEDSLTYTVPDLDSWLPDYAVQSDSAVTPEPLGYGSWTAPTLVQTELDDGDVVILCTASLAESLALEIRESAVRLQDFKIHHGRSPDRTLDVFRDVLISGSLADGAAMVVAFPPRPGSFGVVSLADVGWRVKDRRRRISAQTRSLLPGRVRSLAKVARPGASGSTGTVIPIPSQPSRLAESMGFAEQNDGDHPSVSTASFDGSPPSRWGALTERFRRERTTETWNQPSQTQQYGLPRTHGVQMHRSVSTDRGGSSWRYDLPRFPFSGVIFTALLGVVIALVAFGLWNVLNDQTDEPTDQSQALAQVDQYIVAGENATSDGERRQALELAQASLDEAESGAASAAEIAPRQAAITESLDQLDNVIRLTNLTRVGTLPQTLSGGGTQAQVTPSGLFLVNGGLYQIRTDQQQIVPILEQGERAGEVEVGDLFGIALDSTGLYVTDGAYVYALQPDGKWVPVELGEINELGAWNRGPVGAFGGNIYILESEYRNIYRFDATAEGKAEPYDWVLSTVRPDLVNAVDMAIDASIYVLLDNGSSQAEVLTYLKGDLDERQDIPGISGAEPRSILIGPGTRLLYVAVQQGEDGWVVVFDSASEAFWQLRLPADFSVDEANVSEPFAGLQDVAIDENTGTLYIVNDDAVWTAQYQLPVSTDGTPTPGREGS